MEITESKFPDYYITTDFYPYNESREVLKTLESWWKHDMRLKKKGNIISNYSLDEKYINGIEIVFQKRLHNGCFNFIYYLDQIIAYAGLRIEDKDAYMTRMTTNPFNHFDHMGVVSGILNPYQAKFAKNLGCERYTLYFNDHRFKLYDYWKSKKFVNNKFVKLKGGGEFISNFEFVGTKKFFGMNQHVCTLDLTRPDIDEILSLYLSKSK